MTAARIISPHRSPPSRGGSTREIFPSDSLSRQQRRGLPLTVEAGTVVLMHYDTFHRGSAPEGESADLFRPMFKFQFSRLREPRLHGAVLHGAPTPRGGVAAPPEQQPPPTTPTTDVPARARRFQLFRTTRRADPAGGWRDFLQPPRHEALRLPPPKNSNVALLPLWEDAYRYLTGAAAATSTAATTATTASTTTAVTGGDIGSVGPLPTIGTYGAGGRITAPWGAAAGQPNLELLRSRLTRPTSRDPATADDQ